MREFFFDFCGSWDVQSTGINVRTESNFGDAHKLLLTDSRATVDRMLNLYTTMCTPFDETTWPYLGQQAQGFSQPGTAVKLRSYPHPVQRPLAQVKQ